MTYSFGVRGICKADALLDLDTRVDKIEMPQPDRELIFKHARAVAATLDDPNYDEEFVLLCHGYSVAHRDGRTTSVHCSVSAFIMVKS